MLKNKRLLLVTLILVVAAVVVLGMKFAYPHHRTVAFVLLGLGWIPLVLSYQINRRLLHVQKHLLKKKTRPFLPHAVVALILLAAFYVTWALFPVETSPLAGMKADELHREIAADTDSYLMLRKTADDLVETFRENGLLQRNVNTLSPTERAQIRSLWRDGAMAFFEFDLLKQKYRGFYQVDYVAEPKLHTDAFLLAYMAYVAQYNACLQLIDLVGKNQFMETLLNEEGEGIPPESYYFMKQRLTHPNVVLRMNAAAAYYELVKKNTTIDSTIVADFLKRRQIYFKGLGAHAEIFVENPLSVLEHAAFESILPVQKNIALQMSHIRMTKRDYLITPEILERYLTEFKPGDILIQRRNWQMTNIGIPGFWPHVALYVGTPKELDAYFNDLGFEVTAAIKARYPDVFASLNQMGIGGFPNRVIEAIRPGVVFQSLETSARCDYLGVIRPNLSHQEKFQALMNAFSNFGKPYDLNFDFSTDNELVCSELVYKAYKPCGKFPLTPDIISGRRLLPPNLLAEQSVEHMGSNRAFSFVLFLDALEKNGAIVRRNEAAFAASWKRPKWDILQE